MALLKKLYYQLVYKIYRPYLKQMPLFESLAYLLKYRLVPYFIGKGVQRYKAPTWVISNNRNYDTIKIAVICDEMTWQNFRDECELVFLTPQNWYTELERVKPDLFFCESTWAGNDNNYGCWNYRIFHNRRLYIENRIALLKILKYCNNAKIPTVFWNKEDPTFFNDEVNNFVDTALLFDHIFTTASECVELYERKGHKSVHTMMFGFSPRLFYPTKGSQKSNLAVFFGSWYADQPQRCEDMSKIFDMVLNHGLKLVIYDRQSEIGNENNVFPDKYKPYLHQGIHYSEIRDALQNIQFVININTVKDSQTMFARRVFELMACGKIIISNYSVGMEKLFGNRIWFLDQPFDFLQMDMIIRTNLEDVFLNHTWKFRLNEMFHIVGFKTNCNSS